MCRLLDRIIYHFHRPSDTTKQTSVLHALRVQAKFIRPPLVKYYITTGEVMYGVYVRVYAVL